MVSEMEIRLSTLILNDLFRKQRSDELRSQRRYCNEYWSLALLARLLDILMLVNKNELHSCGYTSNGSTEK